MHTHEMFGPVESNSAVNFTIGVFATEFGISRDVLRRILSEAGVAPAGQRSGNPVYRVRDVYQAVTASNPPENMSPHSKLAAVRAIKVEDEIKQSRGELLDAGDVERMYGALFMRVTHAFETSIDTLERDVGLSAAQAARLEKHFDDCREQLYLEIQNDE